MAQRYPAVKPWLKYRRVSNDKYEVTNEISPGESDANSPLFPDYLGWFMNKLDGKTNPYEIDPSIDRETVDLILKCLSKRGCLRERIRNRDIGRFAFSVVKFDGKRDHSKVSVILNRCLMLLWIPVFVAGSFLGVLIWNCYDYFEDSYFAGIIFGLIIGIALHEAGHMIAARANKAPIYEIGLKIIPLPSAYTLMNERDVKNRLKRTHIYAAGVENNFLLTGLFFTLAFFAPNEDVCTFFFYAGMENLLIGVANLCFFFPLDGFKMMTTLIGADDMVWSMLEALFVPSSWKEQIKKGPSGLALMLCISFLQLAQLIALIWILLNVGIIIS